MNILQVVDCRWFNAAADYGVRLAVGLAGRGHRVTVAGIPGTPPMDRAGAPGLATADVRGLLSRPSRLAAGRYDVVAAHFPERFVPLAALLRLVSPRTALVRVRHDMRPPRRGPLNRMVYGRLADRVAASGEAVRRLTAGGLRLDGNTIRVIPYGTDVEAFRPGLPPPPELGHLVPGAPVVGYLGRLGPVKGEGHLFEALALVGASSPEARFVLALKKDDEPERARRALGEAGLLDRVVILGRTECPAAVIGSFSVGLVSSVGSEANARVLQEYLACGVPAVATRVGVLPEVLAGDGGGLVVPPADPRAMAGAVLRLLSDPPLRHTMAASGRRRVVERFSLDGMVGATEAWYRDLAAARRR